MYSRITGYYRPVQNFNDGKAQEYRDRREYVLSKSVLRHNGPINHDEDKPQEASEPDKECYEDKYILFATKTCPNCKVAVQMLDKAGIEYEKLYVEDNEERARELDLRQAPTLIVANGDSFAKYAGVSNIRKFIDSVVS